jgi:hypothetical protein
LYKNITEQKKEEIKQERLEKIKKINELELNKALYKVRTLKAILKRSYNNKKNDEPVENITKKDNNPVETEETEEDNVDLELEELEDLKNEPVSLPTEVTKPEEEE